MSKKTARRVVLASAVSLMVSAAMAVGSTFAWFTDTVTNDSNIIKSGTLDVRLYVSDDASTWTDASSGAIFNYDKWEPGYTAVKYVKVENKGSLDFKWKLDLEADETAVNGVKLSEVIDVYMSNNIADRNAVTNASYVGTLAELMAEEDGAAHDVLEDGESKVVCIALKMKEEAGNEYQDLQVGSGIKVVLNAAQLTSESDSFGNDYDAGAKYEGEPTAVGTVAELEAALAKGEPVKLTADVTFAEGNYTVAADTAAVIDLNGNDLTVENADETPAFLKVEGDLTIKGEGNVVARQINAYEGSKLTLGEGVILSTANSFAINNSGETVIDGATINHTGTNHAIQNSGTLTIEDATVTSTSDLNISTINSTGGTVTINGGTFTHNGSMGSVIKWLYSDEGEIIINDGTFIQKGGESLASIDYGDAKLTINGGTFDAASYFAQPGQNITINAGEFKNNAVVVFNPFMPWTIADKYVPATSTATTNADGSITVTKN